MKKRTKLLSMILAIVLISTTFTTSAFAALPNYGEEYNNQPINSYEVKFKDVNKKYWAFEYIMEMNARGVLSGYPNGYFYPNNTITRAEFSKIMCLAGGISVNPVEYTSYEDVSASKWYAPYVEAGKYYLSGYVSDGLKYYLPDNNALREDIAVALVKLKGYDTSLYDESILKAMFTDWQSISEGARKYVSVAVENGLISGYEDNTFRGQNTVTRAEAATLLWRAYQYGNGNKVFDKEEFDSVQPSIKEEVNTPVTNDPYENEYNNSEDYENKYDEPEEETYLYEVKTIVSNVNNIDSIISTEDGIFYLESNKIYEVDKNGNKSRCILDPTHMNYFRDDNLTKKEESSLKSSILYIGYSEYDNKKYCIIRQNIKECPVVLFNIDNNEYVDITNVYKELEDEQNIYFVSTVSYKKFYLDIHGNIHINSIILNLDSETVSMIRTGNSSDFASTGFMNNSIARLTNNSVYLMDTNEESFNRIDHSVNNSYVIAVNKSNAFIRNEDGIYSINSNGDDVYLFAKEDIDMLDSKKIDLSKLDISTSVVSNDETFYYWDSNYDCIRQITKK